MLEFTVDGDPKPQGSKRGFVTRSGKVALVEQGGRAFHAWRDTVTVVAMQERVRQRWHPFTEGPVGVELGFRVKKPLKPKYPSPAVRPDIDKLARAVLDALTAAHIWQDDGQVTDLRVTKHYGKPGVTVRVWTTS